MTMSFRVCVGKIGEWWNDDVEEVERQGNKLGLPPKMSDAHTINGKPGPLFPCSEKCKCPTHFVVVIHDHYHFLVKICNTF